MAKALAPSAAGLLLSMLLVLTIFTAECSSKQGSSPMETLHRKLVMEMEKMALSGGGKHAGTMEEKQEKWELRRVPAGPDPLHHNGQDPNKPRRRTP